MSFNIDRLILGPCVDIFGEVAQGYAVPIYTPAGQSGFPLDGVFDAGFTEVFRESGPGVATASPMFGARMNLFPVGVSPAQGDAIAIRGQNYLVREPRPDSHGHIVLLLNKAAG